MNVILLEHRLNVIKKLIEDQSDVQESTIKTFMENFERFAKRITKIEIELFGKSED